MADNGSTTEVRKSDLTPYRAAQVFTDQAIKRGRSDLLDPKTGEYDPHRMYSNKSITRYGTPRSKGGDGVFFVGDAFNDWMLAVFAGNLTTTGVRPTLNALIAEFDEAEAEVASAEADDKPVEDDETELERQLEASLAELDEPETDSYEPKETDMVDTGTSETVEDDEDGTPTE